MTEVRTIGSTRRPGAGGNSPVLEVTELRTHFFTDEGVIRAADGMSLRSRPSGRVGVRQWLPADTSAETVCSIVGSNGQTWVPRTRFMAWR